MGYRMNISKDELGFNDIISAAKSVEDATLKESANIVKKEAQNKLESIKTNLTKVHMYQDVHATTTTDKYGKKVAKVGGGKATGTLWHLVNDGTYKSKPTHFMDNTLSATESEIEKLLDKEMGDKFG